MVFLRKTVQSLSYRNSAGDAEQMLLSNSRCGGASFPMMKRGVGDVWRVTAR